MAYIVATLIAVAVFICAAALLWSLRSKRRKTSQAHVVYYTQTPTVVTTAQPVTVAHVV